MSMNDLKAIALAEIRLAELHEQAEQYRLAQRAADSRRGRKRWGSVLRDELTALRARMSAMQRPGLTKPADLEPAATETT
jgi:hypothetical protein